MNSKHILLIVSISLFVSCKKDEVASLPTEGLVANISLDENAFDEINQITGVNYHAIPYSDHHGNMNGAMFFNRNDSAYLDFGDAAVYSFPQNIFTISCWVMVTNTTQPITILSKRTAVGPFEYSLDNHMNKTVFNFDNWIASGSTTVYGTDPLDASVPIAINQWEQIAVVADGIVLKTYLNGQMVGGIDSIKSGNSFSDSDAPFQIGNGGGYGKNYFFNGAIDDVLIYNRALSEEEIKTLSEL
jgi:hypothetical protein